jgi:hypothetical protein
MSNAHKWMRLRVAANQSARPPAGVDELCTAFQDDPQFGPPAGPRSPGAVGRALRRLMDGVGGALIRRMRELLRAAARAGRKPV